MHRFYGYDSIMETNKNKNQKYFMAVSCSQNYKATIPFVLT